MCHVRADGEEVAKEIDALYGLPTCVVFDRNGMGSQCCNKPGVLDDHSIVVVGYRQSNPADTNNKPYLIFQLKDNEGTMMKAIRKVSADRVALGRDEIYCPTSEYPPE
ncbi:hypothetical protein GGF41_003493, partial [Coemansia sp. RSA 2531]